MKVAVVMIEEVVVAKKLVEVVMLGWNQPPTLGHSWC